LDELIGFNTVSTSKRISRLLNIKLKPYDIRAEQWTVLKRLYEIDEINQKDLSERADKDQATVTKILDLLEKRGLVERKPNPNDRRSFLISITDKGKELAKELTPFIEDIFKTITENISEDELKCYVDVLKRLQENIEKCEGTYRED